MTNNNNYNKYNPFAVHCSLHYLKSSNLIKKNPSVTSDYTSLSHKGIRIIFIGGFVRHCSECSKPIENSAVQPVKRVQTGSVSCHFSTQTHK